MFEGHRVVVVTPAGRERYLRLLAAHVLASPLVDEWHLWQNTVVAGDLAFMRELAALHPRVRLVDPPLVPPDGNKSIGQFFRTTTASDTVYVRLDDDVVWLEPEFFARLLGERLAHKEPLFTYPLIINNAVCSWLLQLHGKLRFHVPVHPWCMDNVAWHNGDFAASLHRWFLERLQAGRLDALRIEPTPVSLARVSINCISWFGSDLAPFGGVFPEDADEEEFASVTLPIALARLNRISGTAICAHFAFWPQREVLDGTDILGRYEALVPRVALPVPQPA